MNPDLRTATRDAARALFSRGLAFYLCWWGGLIVVIGAILTARARYATVDTSTWDWAGTPPQFLLLVLGILLPSLFLPRWVSHGITRRAFSFAGGIAVAAMAVTGGAIITVGYAVESAVYDAAGWQRALEDVPMHLFAHRSAWYLIAIQYTLLYSAWTITGWLIGASYYRWGPWRGTLLLLPALLPVAATETIFDPYSAMLLAWGLPEQAAAIVGLAITVVGSLAAYGVTRNMPLRRSAGWSI